MSASKSFDQRVDLLDGVAVSGLKVNVDHRSVKPILIDLNDGFRQFADRAYDLRAFRLQCLFQIVRKEILVLDNENATDSSHDAALRKLAWHDGSRHRNQARQYISRLSTAKTRALTIAVLTVQLPYRHDPRVSAFQW